MNKRFPMPMPFGWFCIGYADELATGEVKTIHYFDRDMVLFRTEGGDLGLTDPYCPHLGAHLGHGGEVVGESIRCPFHHWTYDTQGNVTDVPYAKRIPPKAEKTSCLLSYPVQEKNQAIWAWYHPDNSEPLYDIQEHAETNNSEWMPLERYHWSFDSCPQEIGENGVDAAHFKYIHGQDNVPLGETKYDGITRESRVVGKHKSTDENGVEREFDTTYEVTQYGAGQKWVRFTGMAEYLLMVYVTPVNSEQLELRFAFTHPKKYQQGSYAYSLCRAAIEDNLGDTGVDDDIPIWHYKTYREDPLLCDGDGPIMRFRKYFEQFYAEGPQGGKKQQSNAA